jgi:hypothetical protein
MSTKIIEVKHVRDGWKVGVFSGAWCRADVWGRTLATTLTVKQRRAKDFTE